jgi:hypothetical protein
MLVSINRRADRLTLTIHCGRSLLHFAVLAALGAACVGCSGDDKPLVPVTGQVTYGGGDWPMPGYITFTPLKSPGDTPARPGAGRFGPDGNFVVGSYRPGDGLMPGRYAISVSCFDANTTKPRYEAEFVPKGFKPEELVIEKGQDAVELNFDVPKKKQ